MQPALIIHGGASAPSPDLHAARANGLQQAFDAGWKVLGQNGSALDAVISAVVILEDDPAFNAGIGSCLTEDGTVEVDASLMDGTTFQIGAVGAVTSIQNPIRLAQAVMQDGRHAFLVGEGAQRFAREHGFPTVSQQTLITKHQHWRWQAGRVTGEPGTVGAVAMDRAGKLAAATSTGGIMHKRTGRVGDSAIIGAGTYADNALGACSATGDGEAILRSTLARNAVELLRDGKDPTRAAHTAVQLLQQRTGSEAGLILIDQLGRIGHAYNTPAMSLVRSVAGQAEIHTA
jgi:beta-aspartyl-peptidase (threonine type)